MDSSVLTEIEASFGRLSRTDQLLLLERLVHHLHENEIHHEGDASELAAMAADPEIQMELQKINAEFAFVDSDGLETA